MASSRGASIIYRRQGFGHGQLGSGVGFESLEDGGLHCAPLGRNQDVDRGRVLELAGQLAEQLDATARFADGADSRP